MDKTKFRTATCIIAVTMLISTFLGAFEGWNSYSYSAMKVLSEVSDFRSTWGGSSSGYLYMAFFMITPICVFVANGIEDTIGGRIISIVASIIYIYAWAKTSNIAENYWCDNGFIFYLAILLSIAVICITIVLFVIDPNVTAMESIGNMQQTPTGTENTENIENSVEKAAESKKEEKTIILLKNKKYDNGPIIMRKVELIINDTSVSLRLQIRNISDKAITVMRMYIRTYNALGEIMEESIEHMIIDINILPGDTFKTDIPLSQSYIRKADVSIDTIMFEDETKWERNSLELVENDKSSSFVFLEHEDIISEFKCAKEIQDYINGLDYPDDDMLNEKIKPMLEEYVYIEKNYGNKKDDVVKKIKGMYEV